MSNKNRKNDLTPADQVPASGNGGISPPSDGRFKPGQSGNPAGRPSAGSTVREHVNSMAEFTEKQLRRQARDPDGSWARRSAAERMLRMLEAGDIADFAGLLRGEHNLEDLRGLGINTEVVKKFKQKTRKVPVGNGVTEEVIEREIELHDRAGADFDRILDRTIGTAVQSDVLERLERLEKAASGKAMGVNEFFTATQKT